jgi:hypothetical protein
MAEQQVDLVTEQHERPLVKATELVKPTHNPLLRIHEKLLVLALTRGASFLPSPHPELVKMKGLSKESEENLIRVVTFFDGSRRGFGQMINEISSKNTSNCFTLLDNLIEPIPIAMAKAGIAGDLDGVIDKVSQGKGNCLESSLVIQLIAIVFYPDEILDAQLLAFSGNENVFGGKTNKRFRHFSLFTRKRTHNGESLFSVTTYGGGENLLTRDEATEKVEKAKAENDLERLSKYTGFLTLVDRSLIRLPSGSPGNS